MAGSGIGIRVADGSYFPVLEEGFVGQKKLVLTTVQDNQTRLQVDLYKGAEGGGSPGQCVGSLVIEDMNEAPQGEPEIEVRVGVDGEGNLEATATDLGRGESQTLSVNLESVAEEQPYEMPESVVEDQEPQADFDDSVGEMLTGETYPIGTDDRRKEHLHKKRHPLLLFGFVVIGLLLIVAVAFLIYTLFKGPEVPPLLAGVVGQGVFFSPEGNDTQDSDTTTEEPSTAAASTTDRQATPKQESVGAELNGVWYRVREGDTLWDISATFYRNPWLYHKIVRANQIMDPDSIFAGTRIFIPDN